MMAQIADDLGLANLPVAARWRGVADETAAAARGGARTVLVIDDADMAQPGSLRALSRLVGACPAMSMIAACRHDRYDQVLQELGGCPLKVELSPWELPEIRDYLQAGLRSAGGRIDVFTDQAVIRLYELSEGLPGVIARLAELALLTGAGCRTNRIGPDLIEAAGNELMRVPVAA